MVFCTQTDPVVGEPVRLKGLTQIDEIDKLTQGLVVSGIAKEIANEIANETAKETAKENTMERANEAANETAKETTKETTKESANETAKYAVSDVPIVDEYVRLKALTKAYLNGAKGKCVGPIRNGRVPIDTAHGTLLVRPDNIDRLSKEFGKISTPEQLDHALAMEDLFMALSNDWGSTQIGNAQQQFLSMTNEEREKWLYINGERGWLEDMASRKYGAVLDDKKKEWSKVWTMKHMLKATQLRWSGGEMQYKIVPMAINKQ